MKLNPDEFEFLPPPIFRATLDDPRLVREGDMLRVEQIEKDGSLILMRLGNTQRAEGVEVLP